MTIFRIGEVDFDPDASEICAQGKVTHLQPQVSSVLACLIRHQGEVGPKDVLVAEAWKGRRTSDESVTRCISLLRGHLSDRDQRHLIETIPKKGYRFTGSANPVKDPFVAGETTRPAGEEPSVELRNFPKTAVNLVLTAATLFILLSGLVVASDFFSLR